MLLVVMLSFPLLSYIYRGLVTRRRKNRVEELGFRGSLESLELGVGLSFHGDHATGLTGVSLLVRGVVEFDLVGCPVGIGVLVGVRLLGRVV